MLGLHMGATPSGTTENLHFLPISCPKRIRRTRAGARGHQLQAGTHPLAQPPFGLPSSPATILFAKATRYQEKDSLWPRLLVPVLPVTVVTGLRVLAGPGPTCLPCRSQKSPKSSAWFDSLRVLALPQCQKRPISLA